MIADPGPLTLSGERLRVTYALTGSEAEARDKAAVICLEQTVEFPAELVPPGDIRDQIVGRVERFEPRPGGGWQAVISYAAEVCAGELTQLLNTVFGNSSIKPGIRVERLGLPEGLLSAWRGPRFGRGGLRRRLGIPDRPLLATALKPMGLPAAALADLAYQFALGGIDIIKDDHGLTDQPFAPFSERVERCAAAVARANRETGFNSIYMANVTSPAGALAGRARAAKAAGAGGLLISPGLTGLDAVRQLAEDDDLDLPIMAHPAFLGSFVSGPDSGMSHFVLFGQLMRLAGVDASIFPNFGGRFSFSREECRSIAEGCAAPMGALAPAFPAPGGGMRLEALADMQALYGRDVIYLIGGGLHQHGPDLVANCRYFASLVGAA